MFKVDVDDKKIEELLVRRIQEDIGKNYIFPSKTEAEKRLKEGKPLRVYLGIDPTGPNLHVGHTVPLFFLKSLQDMGHKPVILIGDFTACIGDPTGKDKIRKPLSEDQVKGNMKKYLEQIGKILDLAKVEVFYNSRWLKKMSLEEIVKLSSNFTVQQMLDRDMFQRRQEEQKPIGIHEFLYPLMQGYDSVAMEIDGEVGGSDQIFNMLVGRDLEKIYLQKDKLVFATRLLVNKETGEKMSKTEGNLISLSDSPKDLFGKIMHTVPDSMIYTFFELVTDLPWENLREKRNEIQSQPRKYKEELAYQLVKIYHGKDKAEKVREEFIAVYQRGEKPEDIVEIAIDLAKMNPVDLLLKLGIDSKSEAKRLIEQGAVDINDSKLDNWQDEVLIKNGTIIKLGAYRFFKLIVR
ncbi:MAG: tyrosine--tRNA ligase [Parcubacteria group bacterium]|nr:tyrosine--tRNA ligase [Parcubacteria group bacterium]